MDRIFCDDCGHESTAHVDGCTVRSCSCRALVKRSQAPTPRRDIGTCKECRFLSEPDSRIAPPIRSAVGLCRRNAPAVDRLGADDAEWCMWPIVRHNDWCGEFERRDQ